MATQLLSMRLEEDLIARVDAAAAIDMRNRTNTVAKLLTEALDARDRLKLRKT